MKRIKKVIGLLLPLLIISGYTVAQSGQSSLLWEISGNGLQRPSYLFGTFHILCKTDFPISDILKEKIKTSQQFYGELAMDDPNLQMQIAMKMMMPDKTLQSLLSEADFKKISENFQRIVGMPLEAFNNFKPFIALSLLAMNSITCMDRIQPETEFAALAKEANLPVFGLETIDDQIQAIDKEPLDSQLLSLKQTTFNFDSVKQVMTNLLSVYKRRDVDSLYAFMKNTGGSDADEVELITKRNRNWLPVIQKAIAEKTTFVAVGAGHLGGPDGVISLLRTQGYKLTPVKY